MACGESALLNASSPLLSGGIQVGNFAPRAM